MRVTQDGWRGFRSQGFVNASGVASRVVVVIALLGLAACGVPDPTLISSGDVDGHHGRVDSVDVEEARDASGMHGDGSQPAARDSVAAHEELGETAPVTERSDVEGSAQAFRDVEETQPVDSGSEDTEISRADPEPEPPDSQSDSLPGDEAVSHDSVIEGVPDVPESSGGDGVGPDALGPEPEDTDSEEDIHGPGEDIGADMPSGTDHDADAGEGSGANEGIDTHDDADALGDNGGDGDADANENNDADEDADSHASVDTDEGAASTGPDADAVSCQSCDGLTTSAVHVLESTDFELDLARTIGNPLKGFMTSYLWAPPANDMEDSMEFLYLPMKAVWGEGGATFEEGLEPLLQEAAERGHHVVLRLFIDYPSKPSGLPDYLAEVVPCFSYSEHGGGCSPDYDTPELVQAMVDLIGALGAQYDGDPRLGVVQVGLLGFWGEWHTYPHTTWFPSLATQNLVLGAMSDSFQVTRVQVRRPAGDSLMLGFGFHDDSFAYSTLGDIAWFFWPSLVAAGGEESWRTGMMGGELRPELQQSIFEPGFQVSEYAQDPLECIETTHTTFLLNYNAFNEGGLGYQGEERQRAQDASLAMGYTFHLDGASLTLSGLVEDGVQVSIALSVSQVGVAPFYYPLFVSIVSSDVDGQETTLGSGDYDLSALMPGENVDIDIPLGLVGFQSLTQPLEVRLSGPILQTSQSVRLATSTPWTVSGGPTRVAWDLVCSLGDSTYGLGESTTYGSSPCLCRCDVDGVMRRCDGQVCEEG